MIFSLDIETIPNPEAVAFLPEPKIDSRLKDPAKVAAAKIEAKADQIAKMALDPLTGRIASFALVTDDEAGNEADTSGVLESVDDAAEIALVQALFAQLGDPEARVATWNGIGFDLPYIYKRAILLGVNPANFGAPPLTAWTKRYNTDKHFDLMQVWGAWSGFVALDTVAGLILHEKKVEIDVTTFPALLATPEGRAQLVAYNTQDARLTWRLFKKMNGTLFA